MATHSSILAWRFPWTEEPGGLQSMGSQRVGQDWAAEHPAPRKQRVFILAWEAHHVLHLIPHDSGSWGFPDTSLQVQPIWLINWRTPPKPDERCLEAVIRSPCFCGEMALHPEHVYQPSGGSQTAICQTQQLHFAVSRIKKCLNICYLKDT